MDYVVARLALLSVKPQTLSRSHSSFFLRMRGHKQEFACLQCSAIRPSPADNVPAACLQDAGTTEQPPTHPQRAAHPPTRSDPDPQGSGPGAASSAGNRSQLQFQGSSFFSLTTIQVL